MESIEFGDTVRVKSTPLTEKLGFAGLSGTVFGFTVPSSSGIDCTIGVIDNDFAISVYFDDRKESFWFSDDLLEFVDHGARKVIRLPELGGEGK